jgi:hypothetical protein
MPILMTDIYAGEQGAIDTRIRRQLEEENRYKLAEQMRVRDEAAKAKEILTRRANEAQQEQQQQPQGFVAQMPTPNVPGDLVPQGMIPQEGLTGFGGMSTPQEGPTGLQPQGDATGLGGMQPTGWSETQPQEQTPAKGTLYSTLDNAETTYTQAQARVDQVKQTANELRKAGLHDQADAYETKTYALQKAADDAKKVHLDVAEKAVEYVGSQANGYLNALKNPMVDPEAAWQRLKLRLQMDGLDTEELDSVPVNQRKVYAEQARDASVSSKDQIAMQKELLRQQKLSERHSQTVTLREKIQADKLRDQAITRNYKERRFTFAQDKQAFAEKKAQYGILHDGIKTDLDVAKTQLSEVDKTIKDYNDRKLELDKGNLYYDTKGNPISSDDEEVRAQESRFLNDQIALLSGRKTDLLGNVQDLSTEQSELEKTFTGLQKEPSAKDEPKPTVGKFVYTPKADATSRKNYEAFMAQSKSIQDLAERSRVQAAAQQRMLDNGFIKSK